MKRKKIMKIIGILATVAAGCNALWFAYCGYNWSWGPFAGLHNVKIARHPGNRKKYDPEKIEEKESVLKGKRIVFLGSSVTYGSSSQGISFADYIGKHFGCEVVKEAVSGTTLVDGGKDSYIARLEKLDVGKVDLLVCQLSTNDATQKKLLGVVGHSMKLRDLKTCTVAGAMEYIIAYARARWSCPVMFYTNPRYDSNAYGKMVTLLKEIQQKWNIGVIDMWNDEVFNQISEKERALYMEDPIHPTKAGYLEWWLPYLEREIERYCE